jgi:hypothetical protein
MSKILSVRRASCCTLWLLATVIVAASQMAMTQAAVFSGATTHVVVPCYNEEKRLPVQSFLQFTSDEVWCYLCCHSPCVFVCLARVRVCRRVCAHVPRSKTP